MSQYIAVLLDLSVLEIEDINSFYESGAFNLTIFEYFDRGYTTDEVKEIGLKGTQKECIYRTYDENTKYSDNIPTSSGVWGNFTRKAEAKVPTLHLQSKAFDGDGYYLDLPKKWNTENELRQQIESLIDEEFVDFRTSALFFWELFFDIERPAFWRFVTVFELSPGGLVTTWETVSHFHILDQELISKNWIICLCVISSTVALCLWTVAYYLYHFFTQKKSIANIISPLLISAYELAVLGLVVLSSSAFKETSDLNYKEILASSDCFCSLDDLKTKVESAHHFLISALVLQGTFHLKVLAFSQSCFQIKKVFCKSFFNFLLTVVVAMAGAYGIGLVAWKLFFDSKKDFELPPTSWFSIVNIFYFRNHPLYSSFQEFEPTSSFFIFFFFMTSIQFAFMSVLASNILELWRRDFVSKGKSFFVEHKESAMEILKEGKGWMSRKKVVKRKT